MKKLLIWGSVATAAYLLFFHKSKPVAPVADPNASTDETTEEGSDDGSGGGAGGGGGFGGGAIPPTTPATDPTQGTRTTSQQGAPALNGNVLLIGPAPFIPAAPQNIVLTAPTVINTTRSVRPRTGGSVMSGPTGPVSAPIGGTGTVRTTIKPPTTTIVAKLSASGPGEGYYSAAAVQYADQGDGYLNVAAAQFADQGHDGYLNVESASTAQKRHCTNMGGTWIYNGGSHEYECKGGALAKATTNIGM